MKRMKKMLSLLLAFVLTFSNMSGIVLAETGAKPVDGTTEGQPFAAGTGGSEKFRIPCMVTLDDGTIVAACDARWNGGADAGGVDTIVSYSEDNGATWNYTFANYLGDNGNVFNNQSTVFIDPSLATDGERVYMIADLYPAGYAINSAAHAATPGVSLDEFGNLLLSADERATYAYHLEKIENGTTESYYKIVENESGRTVKGYTIDAYFNIKSNSIASVSVDTNLFCADSPYEFLPTDYLYLTTSDDGGATWSIPTIINARKSSEQSLLVGPGTGIVTSTGRIIFTVYEYTYGDKNSATIYSDDGGATWTRGESVSSQSSEATIVEADEKLYMFTRHGGYYVSEDWGETWSDRLETGITYNTSCELNALTYSKKIEGKTAIFLSVPSSTGSRSNGKIFVALVQDDGSLDWKYEYAVNNQYYAYSSISELKDGSIGLLYESGGTAITYTNIALADIVGADTSITALRCEDTEGNSVETMDIRPGQEVTLNVSGALGENVQAASDNEAVTARLEGTTLTITASESVTDFEKVEVIVTDGVGAVGIKINVVPAENYEIVNLGLGETATYLDETGNYGDADLSGVDSAVATVTVAGRDKDVLVGLETNTTGTSGADFAEGTAEVRECLYTFTKGTADNTYTISATTADGKTVYLAASASPMNNYPSVETTTPPTTTVAKITDANSDNEFSLIANGVLYFWNNESKCFYFDRNGSGVTAGNCWYELYRAAETEEEVTASATSPIPGYVKITELTEITDGGKYLIAHEGYDGAYYLLHPSASTTDKYAHVAKVLPETAEEKVSLTEIAITGVEEGITSVEIGDITYCINVENANNNVKNITLTKDESIGILDVVEQPEGDVITVAENTEAAPYKAVSEITDGEYLIGNASYLVLNTASSSTSPTGLSVKAANFIKDNLNDYVWTVTAVDGVENGYTIQDANGQYLTINSSNVALSDTARTLIIGDESAATANTFRIENNGYYLNNYSGANTNIAAWNGIDANSRWYFYQPGGSIITGTHCGTVTAVGEETTYAITVEHDCEWSVTMEPTCTSTGVETGTCTICQEEITRKIPVVEHTYGNWSVITEATCTTKGLKTRECTSCHVVEERVIPKTGEHSYSAWSTTTEATCTAKGVQEKTCTVDGCGVTQRREIAKKEHTFGDWTITREATVTTKGEKTRTCTAEACGYTETSVIVASAEKPADGITKNQPFDAGTGGSNHFRIPCLVALDDGSIVAACDARWTWAADAGGIDTIVSRSKDNGATWQYTFANYLGDNGNVANRTSTCFIDPAIATDGTTIYMIADLFPAGYAINSAAYAPTPGQIGFDENGNLRLSADGRESYEYHLEKIENGSTVEYYEIKDTEGNVVEGYTIDAYFNIKGEGVDTNLFFEDSPYEIYPTDYLYLTSSNDGGATWSVPSLINAKKASEQTLLVGPGTGIVTSTGRIVFTVYDFTYADGHSAVIYSDDKGATWTRGESVANQTSEATVVEADGRLYMFTRHGGYYVSEDWGATWSDKVDPGISYDLSTQLNAITYSQKVDGKTAIILSAPAGSSRRTDGKLFVGLVQEDGSLEWNYEYEVNKGAYAYSSLTELSDGSIGLLYEYAGSAITYVNIPFTDIVGIWFEDENGERVNSLDMKAGESVALELFGTPENDLEITSDNTAVTGSWDAATSTVTITADESVTGLAEVVVTVADGSGSTIVLNITVTGTDVSTYEILDLQVGETLTIRDETGDYSDTDVSGTADVAEITLVGGSVGIEETRAQLATAAGDFSGDFVNMSDCLYTFTSVTKTDDTTFTCVLSATAADGTTVYLNQSNATQIPNQTSSTTITMGLADDGRFTINCASNKWLYFWYNNSSKLYFDRNSSAAAEACYFKLYEKSEEAPADSPIPGYAQVTTLDGIREGGKYVIANVGSDGNYYLLHPANGGSNFNHVAKATGEVPGSAYTDITIEAVAEGTTSVVIGNVTYFINVEEVAEHVTLGMYERFFVETTETPQMEEQTVVTMEANGETTPPYTAVSEITNGNYLLGNASHAIINEASEVGSPSGLVLKNVDFTNDELADYMWTVTAVDNGYTIQDVNGKYINIDGRNVTLGDNAQTLTVGDTGASTFSIGNGTTNFNNWEGSSKKVAAYTGVDGNSKWYFYQPADGYWISAASVGTTTMVVNGVKYYIEVIGCQHRNVELQNQKEATCTEEGYTGDIVCTDCKETITPGSTISVKAHEYGVWEVTTEATCTAEGVQTRTCIYEGCTQSETKAVAINPDAHNMDDGEVTTPATCTEAGVKTYSCTNANCDYTTTEVIPAAGHAYSEEFTVDKEATCTEEGSKSKHCANCDATTEVTVIPVTDHTMSNWTVAKAATCKEAGVETRKCTVCGGAEETREIAKLTTHTWDAGTVTAEPTATTEGTKTYTCTVCKTTKAEKIPATGVTEDKEPEKPSAPAKGTKLTYKGATYKITKSALKNGTVTFVSAKKNSKTITVPKTIKVDGITYKVTAIEKNAFKNQKKVTKITIESNVAKIGANVFTNCKNLKTITIKTTKLTKKNVAKNAFKGIKKSTRIKVPNAKVKAYKTIFKSRGLNSKVKVTK